MKKILFFCLAKRFFGSERALLDLVATIKNYRVGVVLHTKCEFKDLFSSLNIDCFFVNGVSIKELVPIFLEYKPNVLHINYHQDLTWEILFLAKFFKIPLVIHVRMVGELSLKELLMFKYAAKVICVSHAVKRSILRTKRVRGLLKPGFGNVEVIYDGVEKSWLKEIKFDFRKKYNIPDNTKLVAIIGAIAPRKRQNVFVEMVKIFVERYSNIPVKFLIVGDLYGDRHIEFRSHVINLISRYGLKNLVIITGREDISTVLNSIDVLVSMSESEAFGLSILEAMACGVPVVVYNNKEGPSEILARGGGILVKDEIEAAEKLYHLLTDLIYYNQLSKDSKKVSSYFDISNTVKKLEKIYSELIGFC